MNIAIVDDASQDREKLLEHIQRYAQDSALPVCVEEYGDGETFLETAALFSLDVVFLDIYMDKLSGMEVAKKLYTLYPSCRIVFVTSSTDYAVQSYAVKAFYYIVKPFGYPDIVNVMDLLTKSAQRCARYLRVKEGREWCKILLSDILYVDYSNHYVQMHTETAIISTYMKFPEMEEKLLPYSEFLSCYRCIVVNMNKIQKIDDLFFLLCNGEYIPINRKRGKEIKSRYADYIFGDLKEDSGNG